MSTFSPSSSTASEDKLPGRLRRHRGFTLVEVALVLILVSMILSGTLRGAELINSTQVKALAADFDGIRKNISIYQDRYRCQPGDDARANAHLGENAQAGNGDGAINGNWNDAGGGSEASRVWQHFRLAGLMNGVSDTGSGDYPALNALGHPVGLQAGSGDPARSPVRSAQGAAMAGSYVMCSRGIPGKLALALDIQLDDANPATGAMLATPDTGASYDLGAPPATLRTGGATDLQQERPYIVCMGF